MEASPSAASLLWWSIAAPSSTISQLEESILTILPSCLVFLLTPILFLHHPDQPVRLRRGRLLRLKFYCAATLIVLQFVLTVSQCTSLGLAARRELPTFSIDLIVAASVAGVVYREYHRAARASVFLGLHVALGLVIDGTKSRAYARHSDTRTAAYVSVISAAVRLVLLLLNEVPKGAAMVDGHLQRRASKETSSGFWGRALFLWLNSTLLLGFRTRLCLNDLDELAPEFSSETLFQKFQSRWRNAEHDSKRSLGIVCLRVLLRPLLVAALPRFAYAVCSLTQPFLLQRLLTAVQTTGLASFTQDSILYAFLLLYFCIAVSRASYHHMLSRVAIQVRGILIAQVLDKSHALPGSGSGSVSSAALTLMSKDVEDVASAVTLLYELPINVLETGLGMCCLALFVGKACLMILLPLSFSVIVSISISKYSGAAITLWNRQVCHRVSETSMVLSQLKVIKMLGLGPATAAYLQRLRQDEIASSQSYRIARTLVPASQMFVSTITPVLVVGAAFYWTFMGTLSAIEIFPSLAAVAIIQRPIYSLLVFSPRVAAMLSCLHRIQNYIELAEDADPRILAGPLLESNDEKEADEAEHFPSAAIEFDDVTLLSPDSETEVIQQANFSLERGSITAALGPSGSGKSALLRSLVGDANVAEGSIYVEDTVIGYADQSPWIRNVSVRANILGELRFDAVWYCTVLRACLLLDDLAQFPGGDEYIAGTNGINLSGGQRHRISLARALYCRARTVVLDNVFNALDQKTAVSILFRLCGENGLLRRAGCTVIIATYLPESLEVVDQLLLLDGKGGATLEKDFGDECFRASLVQALSDETAMAGLGTEDEEKAAIQRSWVLQDLANQPATTIAAPKRRLGLSLYTFFIGTVGKATFAAWLVSVFLVSLGESVPDIFIRVWISAAPDNMVYFAGYVGASIVATLIHGVSSSLLFFVLTPRSSIGSHEKLTDVVMHSTLAYFSSTELGSMLNRYSEDMNWVAQQLPIQVHRFFYMMFHIVLQVLIIASGTTYMVMILPFIGTVAGLLLYCFVHTSRQVRSMAQDAKTPVYSHFTETASGLRHIKAMGLRSSNFKTGLTLLDISQQSLYTVSCLKRWLSLAVDLLASAACFALTSLSLKYRESTAVPAIGLSYLILLTFGLSLEYFFDSWADLDSAMNSLSRLRAFLENTPTESKVAPSQLPSNWPHRGLIEMKNVVAKYGVSGPARLEGVSLRVEPGNKVGITGRSGSGKSSLFLSILGFLDYSGTIDIDGVDISTIARDTLRSRIITISQDHLNLGGTVRNNLRPFHTHMSGLDGAIITDETVKDVLGQVGLLERVDNQGGLDAPLSKVGLSHGQLQLLSIARAILRGKEMQSKVVLMDEATSNVDSGTDAKIQRVLREAFAGCTILMIAHRLETIQDANMFVEVVNGKAKIVKA
ncbi:ABC multidrug transporter [Cordyceps javanica]|uniref:ABC multidrug transporter n=1 Tax=Cordyceps javanica TaxID=43265 RepID=A0A545VWQ2_9HYPO|nr:ABC multidrug transporter [Cordyceps javanica]TQW06149.1 ABC multidrug transporter [Cordyceps javanica]